MVAGAWWMLRELELSTARARNVHLDERCLSVSWRLPVSKTDIRAVGVQRVHRCSCPVVSEPSPGCPVHAVWDQLLLLRRRFPDRFAGTVPSEDLLLFPTPAGDACSKDAMGATIADAGRRLGLREPPDGSEKLGGHSLRATGAQGLSRLGLDLWAVQLIGRWGSDTVKGYVRAAALDSAAVRAAGAARGTDLQALVEEVVMRLEGRSRARDGDPVEASLAPDVPLEEAAGEVLSDKDIAPGAGPELVKALAAEASAAAAESEDPPPPELGAVLNEQPSYRVRTALKSGVWHRVVRGPPRHSNRFHITACGWRFGQSAAARLAPLSEAQAQQFYLLCSRCFAEERNEGKARCQRLRQEGGVP